jgi:hypothetical protein
MANRKHFADRVADPAPALALGGTRAQSVQRLQVGVSLLLGIILIVGLANVIEERAKQSEAAAVPQVAASAAPAPSAPAKDPLADAGVVPDLPAASPTSTAQSTAPRN